MYCNVYDYDQQEQQRFKQVFECQDRGGHEKTFEKKRLISHSRELEPAIISFEFAFRLLSRKLDIFNLLTRNESKQNVYTSSRNHLHLVLCCYCRVVGIYIETETAHTKV